MFLDALGLLSDAQSISADAVSTNTIDLGDVTPKRGIGAGEPMCIAISVDVAADFTTTDETYAFQLIQSASANLSSPDVLEVRTILASALTIGSMHYLPIPPGAVTKRYIGLNYDVGGTSPSITCTAVLQPQSMIQQSTVYADGITIS